VGGDHGPYRQSERTSIYRRHATELLEKGHAFKCYCTPQRLQAMRAAQQARGEQPRYDGHCLHLTDAERAAAGAAGTPHVVRLIVPAEGICTFEDMQRGPISIPWETVEMQVLTKSDGIPNYH